MKNILIVLVAILFCLGYPTSSTAAAEYVPVGCFKDTFRQRALPKLLANYRGNIAWNTDLSYIVKKCAQEAKKKNYVYFSVQFYGECWSGEIAQQTYDRYGRSSRCTSHVGKENTNMVYRLAGDEQECKIYSKLDTDDRAASIMTGSTALCDKQLATGWYRFLPPAGNRMASECVPSRRCGTAVTGWLSSSHPKMTDGIVDGTVCFNWKNESNCCQFSQRIQVRNCGRFFVYKLVKTKGCPMRFCSET